MLQQNGKLSLSKKEYVFISLGILCALLSVLFGSKYQNISIVFLPVAVLGFTVFLILLFRNPFIGLLATVSYCFLMGILDREIGGLSYGTGIEFFLILTWLSVWYNAKHFDFSVLKNDLVYLTLGWFILSFFEIINPAGASPRGWLQEIRSTALNPLLITPLGFLLLNTRKRVDIFIKLIIGLSFLATLNGIKQIKIGPSAGEQFFLDTGGGVTHIIFGQLRVFSFLSDAGQFGASQAHFVVIALVLAIGLKGWVKKFSLLSIGILSFYGMLISGTRGALFVLIIGFGCAILLSKNLKGLIIGGAVALFFLFVLKFTYIGNSNYNIYRLRTGLDTEDASLNVRLINQIKLSEYLKTRPFGGGLGVIGHWGVEYNPDKYLSTIAPDSYWVKVWAMYGIVGFAIFIAMWMYIIGKCVGLLWRLKDGRLRIKLVALLSGVVGIFVCSYGNEVMNAMPSLIIVHLSLSIIYVMCMRANKNPIQEISK